MAFRKIISDNMSDFVEYLHPKDVLAELLTQRVITSEQFSKWAKDDALTAQKVMSAIIELPEEKLCHFAECLRKTAEIPVFDSHGALFDILKETYECHKKSVKQKVTSLRIDENKPRKRARNEDRTLLFGYPYDVSDVKKSSRKGKDFFNSKLLTQYGLKYVVSVGHSLGLQKDFKKAELEERCLLIRGFSVDKKDSHCSTYYLTKFSSLSLEDPDLDFTFYRKVFTLRECCSLHVGQFVDLKFKVIEVKQEEEVELSDGSPSKLQNFFVADETGYTWFTIWKNEFPAMLKGESYHIKKCQLAQIFDLKYIQAKKEETTMTKIEKEVIPLEISDQQLEVEKNNTVTEIVGKITTCKSVNVHHACPECKKKIDEKENEFYDCGFCNHSGVLMKDTQEMLAEATVQEENTDEKFSVTFYTGAILKILRESSGKDLQKRELFERFKSEKALARGICSSEVTWRVRKTPDGNILGVFKHSTE